MAVHGNVTQAGVDPGQGRRAAAEWGFAAGASAAATGAARPPARWTEKGRAARALGRSPPPLRARPRLDGARRLGRPALTSGEDGASPSADADKSGAGFGQASRPGRGRAAAAAAKCVGGGEGEIRGGSELAPCDNAGRMQGFWAMSR